MTVERSLRMIAGAFVAASVLLGIYVNPLFLWFTLFVGLNLFQSAFTQWCPMMAILRKAGVRGGEATCHASPRPPSSLEPVGSRRRRRMRAAVRQRGSCRFSAAATPGSGFVPDVELVLTAAPDEVAVLPGAPTRVWRFTGRLLKGPADTLQTLPGSYLGPVIRLRRGQRVRVRFANQLAEVSIVHWHGLDVPESADGHPRLAIGPRS